MMNEVYYTLFKFNMRSNAQNVFKEFCKIASYVTTVVPTIPLSKTHKPISKIFKHYQ